MTVSSIGRIVSRQNVEQSVLGVLTTWLESTYLPEIEAQNNIVPPMPRPPSAESYYGGVDAMSWVEAQLPAVIVQAVPDGDALRFANAYLQWFRIEIVTVCFSESEDQARQIADWYAAAIMTAIGQNETLDGLATRTILLEGPAAQFADEDKREFGQSVVVFRSLVQSMFDEGGTPPNPGWPPPPIPIAETLNPTVTAVPESATPT